MTDFTREQLEEIAAMSSFLTKPAIVCAQVAAFALALLDRAETAEKRMKAWGCPDEDFICLNCGSETPCMTEADLKPGDPGVPCTFDLTYPQMIERIHYHEDQQRRAKAERDRLAKELEEAEEAILLLAWEHCSDCGGTGALWAGPPDDPQQVQCERCWSEGLVPPPSDPFPIGQRMAHPAVRRALERGGRG